MALLSSVTLQIKIGRPSVPAAAPLALLQALQNVTVTVGDRAPSGFQLTFFAERYGSGTDDPLFSGGWLDPYNRVVLQATISGTPRILMDGFITRQTYNPGAGERSSLVVSGEDVSLKMDLFEVSKPWPNMTASSIVSSILGQYASLGIQPSVKAATTQQQPVNRTPQQNSTDRAYLQQLAGQSDAIFYIEPGPSSGNNTAYWGPPSRSGTAQTVLSVDMGPFSTVDTISFAYDGTAPQVTYGKVKQSAQQDPVAVGIGSTTRTPALAAKPALGNSSSLAANPDSFMSHLATLKVRGSFFQHQGRTSSEATLLAQLATDQSTDNVVTVNGVLDTVRYGDILRAPGLVSVRGAGSSYDGLYYVKQVTHQITSRSNDWEYKQAFVLTREGLGTTIQEVTP
jgi:phage protein D